MVQVDITNLSAECNECREQLRFCREEFMQEEVRLREVAGKPLSKERLQDVEHLHNQFHIQLINIHDLKQAIKAHDRKINFEKVAFNGNANEDSLQRHETLMTEFKLLIKELNKLRTEFEDFLKKVA